MPELRGLDASSFIPHPTAAREIRFKDKAREKQRKLKLENMKHGGTVDQAGGGGACVIASVSGG